MSEKLMNQNVSPVSESSKLAEELTTEKTLEKEVSKYKGFELSPEEKEIIVREVKEGNRTIEDLVRDLVLFKQHNLIQDVMRKLFPGYLRNLTSGVSSCRDLIKATLDEYPGIPKIDYSDFYKYRCEYLKSNMNDSVFLPLVSKVGIGCEILASIVEDFEEKMNDREYKDELHLKYELLKLDYKIAKRYNAFSNVNELVLNNTKGLTRIDKAILGLLLNWKTTYMLEEFKDKYEFYVRLVAKSSTLMGMHLDPEILSALRSSLDIDKAFKEWITEYQNLIIVGMHVKIKDYFELTTNSEYTREVIQTAKEQYKVNIDTETLVKIRENYLISFKDIELTTKEYNFNNEQKETLAKLLNSVETTLRNNYVVDKYSIYYFIMDNPDVDYEDIRGFMEMLEGTFSCKYGTPLHNKFMEKLLELKRDNYGEDFFTGENIEIESDLWNYLFSDAYYKKIEGHIDLFRELERIESRVIYNMLGGLKYGSKVEPTLNREMEGEQLQLLTELFKPVLDVKHVSRKRMKAIAKSVSDVLGLDKVKVETLLDFREEAITRGYLNNEKIVNDVIKKIGAELTYEQFVLFINGIRNIMRRDNETDFIDYLERILERADNLEGIKIDDELKVICSYKVDKPQIALLPLITEKVSRKIGEIEKSKSFAREVFCKGYVEFINEDSGYKVIVSNDVSQATTLLRTSLGNILLTNKIELKDLLSENKITEPCLSIEFQDKVSTYERETLVNDIIENNLRLRRRMH